MRSLYSKAVWQKVWNDNPGPTTRLQLKVMDAWIIAGRSFRSRLIVGTGKYKSGQETARAIEASGAEMLTVAVRRGQPGPRQKCPPPFYLSQKIFLLPHTPRTH